MLLNKKSVAISIVDTFSDDWIETFFWSKEDLIQKLVDVLSQFNSLKEIAEADDWDFGIREVNDGPICCFKRDVCHAYGIKYVRK